MSRESTCDGDFDGELGVAKDGEQGGDAGDDVREHDGGSGHRSGLESGEYENPGADDGADSEPHEVPPVERLLHLVAAPSLHLHQLRLVLGSGQDPILQPPRRLHERPPVVSPAPKRLLREEVLPPKPASSPPRSSFDAAAVDGSVESHPASQ